jgi:hypothetical protein
LKYDTGGEKVVLKELALINGRGLEFVWVRCGHGEEDESLGEEWIARAEEKENGDG